MNNFMYKIGYNIHNRMHPQRQYSAQEKKYLLDHLVRLQPATVLMVDDDDWAREIKREIPNCAVVIRFYDDSDGAFHLPPDGKGRRLTPQQFYDEYAKRLHGGLILNVINEPNGYDERDKPSTALKPLAGWMAKTMDLFGKAGLPICGPNFGEGHPDVDKLSLLDELWDAFKLWGNLHYYSIHEYGTWRGMLHHDNGQWDVYPWRVGRFERFTVPYLVGRGQEIPRVIVTEWGVDSAHDSSGKRGWKDQFSEVQYFGEMVGALEQVYAAPHYVGVCTYCYGNTGQDFTPSDWRSFDVSQAYILHAALENHKMQLQTLVPKPDSATMPVKVVIKSKQPLRTGPGNLHKQIAEVGKDSVGLLYNLPVAKDRQGQSWQWWESDTYTGWLLMKGIKFEAWKPPVVESPPPVEPPEPEPTPRTVTIKLVAAPKNAEVLDIFAEMMMIRARFDWMLMVKSQQLHEALGDTVGPLEVTLELP